MEQLFDRAPRWRELRISKIESRPRAAEAGAYVQEVRVRIRKLQRAHKFCH